MLDLFALMGTVAARLRHHLRHQKTTGPMRAFPIGARGSLRAGRRYAAATRRRQPAGCGIPISAQAGRTDLTHRNVRTNSAGSSESPPVLQRFARPRFLRAVIGRYLN
jgi:hypothetical protein